MDGLVAFAETFQKPPQQQPLSLVWENLGNFSPDVISNYLRLHAEIASLTGGAMWQRDNAELLRAKIRNLRDLIAEEARRSERLLEATEYPAPTTPSESSLRPSLWRFLQGIRARAPSSALG